MAAPDEPSLSTVNFRFENIGPVKHADLQLGDLTIIAGRNNTGKTYLVYTLYGFLKNWLFWPGIISGGYTGDVIERSKIIDFAAKAIKRGEATLPITPDILTNERTSVMHEITRQFSEDTLPTIL